MAYEQRDMSGSLFKHDKRGNEKAPDYSGSVMINGRVYYLSAWIKTSQAGSKYMSLSANLKDAHQGAPASRHDDDDLDVLK